MIDRPGIFTAVGTQLTYQRPNEIRSRKGESITAPGPVTENLHVYVRCKLAQKCTNTEHNQYFMSAQVILPLISLSLSQLIYQQPGPSVYYEYSVPLQITHPTPEPGAPSDILPLGKCTR